MTFGLLETVLEWGAKKGLEGVLKSLTPSELSSRLKSTIKSWVESLPPDFDIEPDAVLRLRDISAGPARKLISQRMTDGRLPTRDEWLDAVTEWWNAADKGADMQPFFRLSDSDVLPHLRDLAARLNDVCQTDKQMCLGVFVRAAEWRQLEDYRNTSDQPNALLFINEVIEPPNYKESYEIDFHAHNPTQDEVLINRLRIEVQEARKIDLHRIVTPGHPGTRYSFVAHLTASSPTSQLIPMGSGHREFRLTARGGSDLFSVTVSGDPGYDYFVRLVANETNLRSNQRTVIKTPELCLTFAGV
ncbi:hypothetical protein NLM31_12895 [Bradyrhizobium sp. CCGUVB4N]|uniref:hypothetical protein n=1 Tax=Bradyrhizobium sp. CCGUVB4N TaxID=2949631 RepID=UPI0020B23238|nr:hypothetical protein [Bradyrhizobium sp. CCGUVB4N]MCP3381238.1 hypothetical protein [Bradyrhizobium sp. CCGUVB4N]